MFVKFIKSVGFALTGIKWFFKNERNAPVHLAAATGVIVIGVFTELNSTEWCFIALAIGVVLAAEIFNTAIEKTVDVIFKEQNENAGLIKDLAAGGVLVCSLLAAAIGAIIFLPKMLIHF